MRRHSPRPTRRRSPASPLLEPLEDRSLLSAVMGHVDLVSTFSNGMPFQVAGWAFDADVPTNGSGPVTVRLDIDGFPVSTQQATITRDALVPVVGSADHGFDFAVTPLAPGRHLLRVVAFDQPLGQARTLGFSVVTVQPGAIGVVDSFDLTNGINGWAVDPALSTSPVTIQVNIDGHLASFTTADQVRNDLTPFLGSANHGFHVDVPALSPGAHEITVFALSHTGKLTLLATLAAATPGPPFGHLDLVNENIIGGWAVDPSDTTVGVKIRIDIDGVTVRSLTTNIARPGLAKFGTGPFGFEVATPTLAVGRHTIQVFALDNPSGTPTLIGSTTLMILTRNTLMP